MTYTPPGQEPQQPQQPSYSSPDQSSYATPQASYGAPQSSYATPQYAQNQYAGYAASAPKPKSDKKTLGLWAMILGLSGLLIPLFINNLAAVGLGIFGLIRENSKGMSITGIVSGAIGFLWGFFFWPIVITLVIFAGYAATGY